MLQLPRYAVAATIVWFALCVLGFAAVVRGWRLRRAAQKPQVYPAALLNGVFLLALAPVISMLQYVASGYRASWGGTVDLLAGMLLIGYHFALRRGVVGWAERSAMTFREKSIVAQIAGIVLVYGCYGVRLWGRPLTRLDALATLIGITVWMLIISVVFHVTIAAYAKSYGRLERIDERDRRVVLRGARNAYIVLAAGIWCVIVLALAQVPYGALFYAAMGIFAVAELVRLGSQLLYYRLGA